MSISKICALKHYQVNDQRNCALTCRIQIDHSSITTSTSAGQAVGCALLSPRTDLTWTNPDPAIRPSPRAMCHRSLINFH